MHGGRSCPTAPGSLQGPRALAQGLGWRGLLPGDVLYIYTGWEELWQDPDVSAWLSCTMILALRERGASGSPVRPVSYGPPRN